MTLRGTTALGPAAVRFDAARFLPPGRNPVSLMAGVFRRFLPHLRLDDASVARAETARRAWTFGGYVPDVGNTDTLLQQMARQAACTVFKDMTGAYQIVADEPGRAPDLRLDGRRDIYASQVALTWDDMAKCTPISTCGISARRSRPRPRPRRSMPPWSLRPQTVPIARIASCRSSVRWPQGPSRFASGSMSMPIS